MRWHQGTGNRIVFEFAFVAIAIVFTGWVLAQFAKIIASLLAIEYSWGFELGMVTGQVLFQWVFLWRQQFAIKWRYAVQVITVSLLGAVLLLPPIGWNHWVGDVSIPVALGYFFAVVGVMFISHWQRVKRLGLPWYICGTWVLYRCLLLLYIGNFPWR